MLNTTKVLKKIYRDLGATHAPLEVDHKFILEVIRDVTLKTFEMFYATQVTFALTANDPRLVTEVRGRFRIPDEIIKFGDIIQIKNVVGGNFYSRSSTKGVNGSYVSHNSTAYFASSANSVIDAKLFSDIASAADQPLTWKFFTPNILEIYPRSFAASSSARFLIEVMVKHNKNFFTIDPTLEDYFYNLALIDVKHAIYNIRKNYSTISTAFGSLELNLESFEGMEDKRTEQVEIFKKNYWKSRHRKRIYHD